MSLHETAPEVLRDIGMRVLEDSARDRLRQAGAVVEGDTVKLDPGLGRRSASPPCPEPSRWRRATARARC